MTGAMDMHSATKTAISQRFLRFFDDGVIELENLEDVILATPRRTEYTDIGMGEIDRAKLIYLLNNMSWIFICLFANQDFRECFYDAVMIEKALLQVSREEYRDFREDMLLDEKGAMPGAKIGIDFTKYNGKLDSELGAMLSASMDILTQSGTSDAYWLLERELKDEALERTRFAVYNMVYLLNAIQHNGVFYKYVTIVVDNVKKQLAG